MSAILSKSLRDELLRETHDKSGRSVLKLARKNHLERQKKLVKAAKAAKRPTGSLLTGDKVYQLAE